MTRSGLVVFLMLASLAQPVMAKEAWLVTYGPGHDVWERFGHNAIWLRDSSLGLDHVYSFGYFDMDGPGFYLDFARGHMPYYGLASSPEDEFAFYRLRDRSITLQKLALDAEQFQRLHASLHNNIFPVPQFYDYDYFFDNCSTWLRNLLDEALAGALARRWKSEPAHFNIRDQIRRYNHSRLDLKAGLLVLLGPMIDKPRSAWEETFLPDELARWADRVSVDGRPLVSESRVLYRSKTWNLPDRPVSQWWAYALVSALAALLLILARRRLRSGFWSLLPWRAAVFLIGGCGVVILLMWFGTSHAAVAGNRMVLLLNPAWLLFLLPLPRMIRTLLWWLLLASSVAAAVLLASPSSPQYRPGIVVGLLPLLAAVFWIARDLLGRRAG
ncbi:MAG TPA: DUF4105 domain-containing protein [Wenzhouxiangella sp.]|nr:DUF4105 domain-containing protein [Wenzhouxiangella sp.]